MLPTYLTTALLLGSPTLQFGHADLSTGVRLHYAEQGDPSGKVLILLHGYSDSWFSFSRILPLIPSGYRVYALDQRGHGLSDRPAGGYAPRDLAADVVAFMNAKGVRRATLVGHSMGSLVAQQVALAAPRRIDGLVLVGSAADIRNVNGISELEAAVNALTDPVPEEFIREFQTSTIYAPVPDEFLECVIDESRKLSARVWQALLKGMLATGPATGLGKLRIPSLLVWGARDAYFPASEQQALRSLLGTAELKVYEETGHSPHWERPEEFVSDLAEFVD